MKKSAGRPTEDEIEATVHQYGTPLYRLCFAMLGNQMDAEDAVEDTLLRYLTKAPVFVDESHKKAWLFKTATNVCKDQWRFLSHRKHVDLDEIAEMCASPEQQNDLEALIQLPEKYRVVLYLYYVEGYHTDEIASMLHIRGTAVRKRLQKGRKLLKIEIEKEEVI